MLPSFVANPPAIAKLMDDGGPQIIQDGLRAGQTLTDIARRYGGTRGALTRYIASLPPDMQQAIRQADAEGMSALVEANLTIADSLAEEMRTMTKPMYVKDHGHVADLVDTAAIVAADKERIRVREFMAERKDRETWGGKAGTEVTVNLNAIHLDVLRQRTSRPTEVQPAQVTEISAAQLESLADFL